MVPMQLLNRLITLFLSIGLLLTLYSWANLCTSACSQVHEYKFFGFDFEIAGFLFFTTALFLHLFSGRVGSFLSSMMVASAVGAEVNLILVQKYVIGQWCPVCLSIAATIFILATLMFIRFIYRMSHPDQPVDGSAFMKQSGKFFSAVILFILGFLISYMGVFKPESSFAEGISSGEVPYFGNPDSNVEVYIVTDWFCPACKAKEPLISSLHERIMVDARLYYIDYPVHPESMNFVPYNLSFMIKNKDQYFNIRRALEKIAARTKKPTEEEIEAAVRPFGVVYQQLDYTDVNDGVNFMEGIVKTFKVKQTPTIVVANQRNLNAKTLTGNDITKENILNAIKEMQIK